MTELAAERPDGLACLAFPFSVESLEIVASLLLVTQRRAGRRVGRCCGWPRSRSRSPGAGCRHGGQHRRERRGRRARPDRPGVGWLARRGAARVDQTSVSMFDHADDDRPAVRDDQRSSVPGAAVPRTVPGTGPDDVGRDRPGRTDGRHWPVPDGRGRRDCCPERLPRPDLGVPAAPVDVRAVSDLTPAARAARAALAKDGRPLSRDAQAERMRDDGYGCPTPAHRCY